MVLNISSVVTLLDKMRSQGKFPFPSYVDFRFMATSDLTNELLSPSAEPTLHDSYSYKLLDAVLNTLNDKNGEVQNMGVKCLAAMVPKLKEQHIEQLIDRLSESTNLPNQNSELRDISTTALRTVILEINPGSHLSHILISRLLPRLQFQLGLKNAPNDIDPDTIQIFHDLFTRFGREIATIAGEAGLGDIQMGLFRLLSSSSAARRKKAVLALGSLSAYESDRQFSSMMSFINEKFAAARNEEQIRTMVSLIQALCRSDAGSSVTTPSPPGTASSASSHGGGSLAHAIQQKSRFGVHIKTLEAKISPCVVEGFEDETREGALACLETFVLKNPVEMTPFVEKLLDLSVGNLTYDPNYVEIDENEDEMEDAEDDDYEDDEFDEGYSDDDDASWKVRRAAAKLIGAAITSYPSILANFYGAVAPVLIYRFSEREESVRVEILVTFRELVRVTSLQSEQLTTIREVPVGVGKRRRESSQSGERPPPPKALEERLQSYVPRLSKALTKQLSGKSVATKLIGFALAREIVDVLGGGFSEVLVSYIRPIESALQTSGQSKIGSVGATGAANESTLKIEALKFIKTVFKTHSAKSIGQGPALDVAKVVEGTIANEKFYKVVAEALDSVVSIIPVLHALGEDDALFKISEKIRDKVVASDVDQEVREKAIIAFGTVLKAKGPDTGFTVLFDKLNIESTRLVTVRVIADVLEHSTISGGPWIEPLTGELSTYLRRNNREVKGASLKALFFLVPQFPSSLSNSQVLSLVENILVILRSDDNQLYPLAVDTLTLMIENCEAQRRDIVASITPVIDHLFQKQIVQPSGSSWTPYGNLLQTITRHGFGDQIYAAVDLELRDPSKELDDASAARAKGLATIIAFGNKPGAWEYWSVLPADAYPTLRVFRLMVIGECGKLTDISQWVTLEHLFEEIRASDERIRTTAAFAVGGYVAGNIPKNFQTLIDRLQSAERQEKSLLLHSIKEVITFSSEGSRAQLLSPYDICGAILKEENLLSPTDRNLASECIGQYFLSRPQQFHAILEPQAKSPSWHVRATFIGAIRYTMSDSSDAGRVLDTWLGAKIVDIFSLLEDPELEVRRQALVALNGAAHSKPYLIKHHLSQLLPLLYRELEPRSELIRVVVMGPFKHTIDDGLETRRSAYEALYSVLENLFVAIDNVDEFVAKVVKGLDDQHEIKILCSLMVVKLAAVAPLETQRYMEQMTPKFQSMLIISTRDKDSVTRQDIEKQHEMRRSCIRTSVALSQLMSPGKFAFKYIADEEITPNFCKYIKDLRRGEDEKEFQMLATELRNSALPGASTSFLSVIGSNQKYGRNDVMDES